MHPSFRHLQPDDIDPVVRLWEETPGMGLSDADRPAALLSFLQRNPGLSWVAEHGHELVGAVLVGHDGRRGWMHHLAVRPAWRRQGVAQSLVDRALQSLGGQGIAKCHVMVFQTNALGQAFWAGIGAAARDELALFSLPTSAHG